MVSSTVAEAGASHYKYLHVEDHTSLRSRHALQPEALDAIQIHKIWSTR